MGYFVENLWRPLERLGEDRLTRVQTIVLDRTASPKKPCKQSSSAVLSIPVD